MKTVFNKKMKYKMILIMKKMKTIKKRRSKELSLKLNLRLTFNLNLLQFHYKIKATTVIQKETILISFEQV